MIKDGKQISYDVKKDLLAELNRDSQGHPYVDLFVSTHPHDDHCIGFKDNSIMVIQMNIRQHLR